MTMWDKINSNDERGDFYDDGDVEIGDYLDSEPDWGDVINSINAADEVGDIEPLLNHDAVAATLAHAVTSGDFETGDLEEGDLSSVFKGLKKGTKKIGKAARALINSPKKLAQKLFNSKKAKKGHSNHMIHTICKLNGGGSMGKVKGGRFIRFYVPMDTKVAGSASKIIENQGLESLDYSLATCTTVVGSGIYDCSAFAFFGMAVAPLVAEVVKIVGIYGKIATPVLTTQNALFSVTIQAEALSDMSNHVSDLVSGDSFTVEVFDKTAEFAILFPVQKSGKVYPGALRVINNAAALVRITGPSGYTIYLRPILAGTDEANLLAQ